MSQLFSDAHKIGSVIRAASSFVSRKGRVSAEWACYDHFLIDHLGRYDLVRGGAVFNPILQCAQEIMILVYNRSIVARAAKLVWSVPPATVQHSRHHK